MASYKPAEQYQVGAKCTSDFIDGNLEHAFGVKALHYAERISIRMVERGTCLCDEEIDVGRRRQKRGFVRCH